MNNKKKERDYEDILATQDQKKSYHDYSSDTEEEDGDEDGEGILELKGDDGNEKPSSPINYVTHRAEWKQMTMTQHCRESTSRRKDITVTNQVRSFSARLSTLFFFLFFY